jgi:hypothetical protein
MFSGIFCLKGKPVIKKEKTVKVPRFSHPLISSVLITIIIAGALSLNAPSFAQTLPGSSPSQGQQGCVQLHITGSGESTLTMPDACVDGLC